MHDEIYSNTIVPAGKSKDGETPHRVFVTNERNCFLVWEEHHDLCATIRHCELYDRSKAIDKARDLADGLKADRHAQEDGENPPGK